MKARTKAGFTLPNETRRMLKALAIVRETSQSEVIERALDREVSELPTEQRQAVEALRGGRES